VDSDITPQPGKRRDARGYRLQQSPAARQADHPTVPLAVSAGDFRALPEGALLDGETYYIASIRAEAPDCNLYGIEETQPVFPCANMECGFMENAPGQQACVACGTALNGVMPIHRKHQLQEFRDFSQVAMIAHISELGLSHPRLLVYPYFAERPYGLDNRYYVVLPDPTPMLANKVPLPQKIARVMGWGDQLADALAYLHAHGICWREISPDHVALRERQAMWIDFSATEAISSNRSTAAGQKAQDVRELARSMFYLATGRASYASVTDLPAAALSVFERTLGERPEITTAEALADAFRETVIAIRRPSTLRLHVGRHTDVGMVRDLNEDSLLVLELDRVHRSMSQPVGLYAVADGMGGHAAGDVASGLAINLLAQKMATHFLVPQLTSPGVQAEAFDAQGWLAEAMQAANEAVYAHRQRAGTNMGTTLVAALVVGNRAHIANVGDSRAYIVSGGDDIRQITTDHSLVERLISTGQLRPDEARVHPQRNVIYRTVGDKERAQVDFFVQDLNPGDSLLLCSDGLCGKVEDAEICRLVTHSRSPQEACEQLVQAGNDNGGDDNITVIIIQASG
jgi:protein phosphatase